MQTYRAEDIRLLLRFGVVNTTVDNC